MQKRVLDNGWEIETCPICGYRTVKTPHEELRHGSVEKHS
jgi:hypothetical protein